MPVWLTTEGEVFVFSEEDVLSYRQDHQEGNPFFAMMIANLVADQRLHAIWNIEDLIDILFGPSLTPQKGTVIEQYLSMYRVSYGESELSSHLDTIE